MRTFIKKYPGIAGSPIHDLLPFISFINDDIFEYKNLQFGLVRQMT